MNLHSHSGVALLRQLKGSALPVLLAMILSGADVIEPAWIASATGLSHNSVMSGLRSLAILSLATQLSTKKWQLSTGYTQLGLQLSNFDRNASSSSRDIESINYIDSTTTTPQLSNFDSSGLPELLISMGCSREKAVLAVNAALRRGESDLQIRSRINACKESKFKPRYPRGFWAASVILDGRAIPEAEVQSSRNYDGYLDALE